PRALLAAEEAEHTGQVGHTEAEEVRAASGPDRHSRGSGAGAGGAGPDGGRPAAGADGGEAPDSIGASGQGRTADDDGPAGSAQKQPPDALTRRGEHLFLVMGGIGFDAAMVAGADDNLKARMGWFAYFVAGVRHLHG